MTKVKKQTILLAVGGLLAFWPVLASAGEAKASVNLPAAQSRLNLERLTLAQEDPQKFLKNSLDNYNSTIRDYTCTFLKQELLKGKLSKEQTIFVKFRETPFSVFMKWIENPSMVDKVLYVKDFNNNKAMIKPAGILGWFVRTHVNRPVDTPDAAKMSRRRLDQFGFGKALGLIIEVNETALKANDLKLRYTGTSHVDGRATYIIERFLPEKSCYPDQHMIVHIDQQWLVPLAIFCYDARNNLLGKYIYKDVKLNVGMPMKEFTAQANGL
jgi:hypothetical protein